MNSGMTNLQVREADIEPVRYIVEAADVSACFAAIGKAPPQSEYYQSLPAAAESPPDYMSVKNGKLTAEAECIFEALAQPSQIISFRNFATGSDLALETRIVRHVNGKHFVLGARDDADVWDLALLTEPDQMLAVIDGLCDLNQIAAIDENFVVELSLPALTVLSAIAQLARLAEISSDGDGANAAIETLTIPVPAQHVISALERETEIYDMRSPIARMALASDGLILGNIDQPMIDTAIRDCAACGLLDEDNILTADGQAIVNVLKDSSAQSMLRIATTMGEDVVLDDLQLIYFSDTVLTGAWQRDENGQKTALVLTAMDGLSVLETINALLSKNQEVETRNEASEPAIKGRFCQHCGAEQINDNRFCTQCGEER